MRVSTLAFITAVCINGLLMNSIAHEDNPFTTPGHDDLKPFHIRIELKMIEVDLKTLAQLTNDQKSGNESLYFRTQKRLKNNEAQLIHQTMVIARSGEKATIESHSEMIYPSDYELSSFTPPQQLKSAGIAIIPPLIRPHGVPPTSFETCNVGDSIEIEPTVSDDPKFINVRLSHNQVSQPRFITWVTHHDQWGEANVFYPQFERQRTSLAATLRNGKVQFLNSYTPNDAKGKPDPNRKILVFVKATIISPR